MNGKSQNNKNPCNSLLGKVPRVIWDGSELTWVGKELIYLRGVGYDYLCNDYFELGFKKIIEKYRPRKRYKLGLILPCSYGKPYSQSYIHYFLIKAIKESGFYNDIHQIIVTNAGVVPRELDEYYPYCAYDWNPKYETKEIKEAYTEVLAYRLATYIKKFKEYYEKWACYLRWNSDSYRAVQLVKKDLNIEIPNLMVKNVPQQELYEISLEGIYEDEDLILITPTALKNLTQSLIKIIKEII